MTKDDDLTEANKPSRRENVIRHRGGKGDGGEGSLEGKMCGVGGSQRPWRSRYTRKRRDWNVRETERGGRRYRADEGEREDEGQRPGEGEFAAPRNVPEEGKEGRWKGKQQIEYRP